MIIYLAGKMTGLSDFGHAHFMAAEMALSQVGHSVLNPAALPSDLPRESYLPITLAMLNAADAIFMLTGWVYSEGATVEYYFARYQGKEVFYEENWEDCVKLGIEITQKTGTGNLCTDCTRYSGNAISGTCTFTGDTRFPDTDICKYFRAKESDNNGLEQVCD